MKHIEGHSFKKEVIEDYAELTCEELLATDPVCGPVLDSLLFAILF